MVTATRAIKNGLRFCEHGLPLMGSGDWNDGMNLVGEHGKGESVWLAFSLYDVLVRFEPRSGVGGDGVRRRRRPRLISRNKSHQNPGRTQRLPAVEVRNPVNHGNSERAIATYKVEPYVVAADVYTNPQHAGRGGWTWYTGSAGWMYRLITESLLGLHLEVDRLRVEPVFPGEWQTFDLHYRYRETFHHIHVRRVGGGNAVSRVVVDGVQQPDHRIPLSDDRRDHHAEVEVGGPPIERLRVE